MVTVKVTKLEGVNSVIKAAYLLGLRRGPFTRSEITSLVGSADLDEALAARYLTRREERFTLSQSGRARIRVVLAGGVYDVLHLGHLAALTEAKSYGDVLVAVVASDTTVGMLKGRKPIFPEEDRRKLVEELKPVDKAILGYEDVGMGYEEVLKEVKPDVVAFGYDQENLERTVREIITMRKLKIEMVRLSKFESEKFLSSTSVRQRLSESLR
jgi:cytidyltransferase-like protein